jgi:hypothetical protein
MRFYLPFLLLLLISSTLTAQSVTNVVAKQEGTQGIIQYDLSGTSGTNYHISVFYSTDNGSSWSQPLRHISGDVNGGVRPGKSKKIIWDAHKEVNFLNHQVVFKVEARANVFDIKPASSEYGTVRVLSAKRVGNELLVTFSFTYEGDRDSQSFSLYEKCNAISSSGQAFPAKSGNLGIEKFYGSMVCFKNVPINGTLRFPFDSNDEVLAAVGINIDNHVHTVRNIPIQ